MPLMFSVSGLRGIVDTDLTPEIVTHYARAFGQYVKPGVIIVGRDARASGERFQKAVISGLHAVGCSVVNCGIVPTPTVIFMVKKMHARGGIVITASHNPIHWNALKFVSGHGRFLNEREFISFSGRSRVMAIKEQRSGKLKEYDTSVDEHIEKIIGIVKPHKNKLRVAVDAVAGAGSVALPRLLEKFCRKVYRINCRFSPRFPRKPEPTPENIKALCRLVREKNLDLGFACDPDCDRLAIVDEYGHAIGEELSLVLATDHILSQKPGDVVTNLSTTALMDVVTQRYDCTLHRTKVGEAHVVSLMEKTHAVIGGEGNGGIIVPSINFTRDALVGAALVIQLMHTRNATISELLAGYPRYYMVKRKLRITRARFEARKKAIMRCIKGRRNLVDGLRIAGNDFWLHIRPSKTEPLVRIIGEANSKSLIEHTIRKLRAMLA